jgi:hypothetical protein
VASAGNVDWEAWRQAVEAEAVSPLLYRVLRGQEIIAPALEGALRLAYFRSARRNALAFRELGDILRRLAAAKIPAIVLKGAALAETVYGNIAVRPMADLDLLVQRGQMPGALRALEAAGYIAAEPEARAGLALEFENELALRKPGPVDAPLELHWSLLDSPHHQRSMSMDWFWQTARSPLLGGEGVRVLGPEAQLLHLCAHLVLHHHGQGLLWHHDIAEVIAFYGDAVDWEELLARACAFDLVLPLQTVLPRVAEGWGAPVPPAVLARLHALQPSPDEMKTFRLLTAPQRPVAQRLWTDLMGMAGWKARLGYSVNVLFPSATYMRHRYAILHPLLLPLYYPYRWWLGLRSAWRKGNLPMSRSLRILFLVHAVVALILGLPLLLVPGRWLTLLGWAPIDPIISRLLGAALLALGWSSYRGWRATDRGQVAIVIEMEVVYTVLGSLAILRHLAVGSWPAMVWILFIAMVLFAIAWIVALVKK